jgi:nucleotide-binding universal stress UspA family protein
MTTTATLAREVAALRRQVALVGTFTATGLPSSPLALAVRSGLTLDPWQTDALTSTTPRALWNVARQLGKSTVASLLALYVALTEPGALVLLVAPAERQSAELLLKVREYASRLGHPIPPTAEGVLHLTLANGSRLLALPGKTDATVRGFSAPRLILIDEAARVPDVVMTAISPMLATRAAGRLIVMSTPFGRRGWFHREWTEGADWERVEILVEQCPRIPAAFLARERATMPAWIFEQEYHCVFGDTEQSVFRYADVQAALSAEIAPLFAEIGA